MELIATRTLNVRGRRVTAYEQFTVDDKLGRVLEASGRAVAPEPKKSGKPPTPKAKGKAKTTPAKAAAAPEPPEDEDDFEDEDDELDLPDEPEEKAPVEPMTTETAKPLADKSKD